MGYVIARLLRHYVARDTTCSIPSERDWTEGLFARHRDFDH
jgi:hypothetical protein